MFCREVITRSNDYMTVSLDVICRVCIASFSISCSTFDVDRDKISMQLYVNCNST